jgi:hypothetical protein
MEIIKTVLFFILASLFVMTSTALGSSDIKSDIKQEGASAKAGAESTPATIKSDPDFLESAKLHYRNGRYDQAIALLAGPATADPLDFDINVLYAKALLSKCAKLKKLKDVFYKELVYRGYEIGIRLNKNAPGKPAPYYLIAKSLLINDRSAKALPSIEKAIYFASSEDEDYGSFLEILGDCQHIEAGSDKAKLKEAISSYKAALEKGSQEQDFSERLKKKLKKARAKFKKKRNTKEKK